MDKNELSDWKKVFQTLDESQKRWFAAQKAREIGHGGITLVSQTTDLSRTTILKGIRELEGAKKLPADRVRKEGGGRKKVSNENPKVLNALDKILEETSAGDPMTMLRWTCKSSRKIAETLKKQGFKITYTSETDNAAHIQPTT